MEARKPQRIDPLLASGDFAILDFKLHKLPKKYRGATPEHYVPILVEEVEDRRHPFNALLVDTTQSSLPVYELGFGTGGELILLAQSLDDFQHSFLQDDKKIDTEAVLQSAVDHAESLAKSSAFEGLLTFTSNALRRFAPLYANRKFKNEKVWIRIGALFYYKGWALKNLKQPGVIEAYEEATRLCSEQGRVALMEHLCYEKGGEQAYRRVRELCLAGSGFLTTPEQKFKDVKADGFASVMLNDSERARYCYELISDRYRHTQEDWIDLAHQELMSLTTELAKDMAKIVGAHREPSVKDTGAIRQWWDQLSTPWKNQFYIQLAETRTEAGRKAAVENRSSPTDRELCALVDLKEVTLYSAHPVTDLQPLTFLRRLESLKVDFQLTDYSSLSALGGLKELTLEGAINDSARKPISELHALEKISLRADNATGDLEFLSELRNLRDVCAFNSIVADLRFLRSSPHISSLTLTGNGNLTDVSALAAMPELEYFDFAVCKQLRDISAMGSLKNLKRITISRTSVVDLTPIGACSKLYFLDAETIHGMPYVGALGLLNCPKLKYLRLDAKSLDTKERKKLEKQFGEVVADYSD